MNLPYCHTLSIDYSTITEDSARSIAHFIANSQLLKLELFDCAIEGVALTSIINSVKQSSLLTLKFVNVRFGNDEATALANAIALSSLTKLSFIKCNFDYTALTLIASAIKTSRIETLVLDYTRFSVEAIVIIADCIANSKLTKLSLQFIGFHGVAAYTQNKQRILDAITRSSLKILDVRKASTFNYFDTINDLILHKDLTKFKYDSTQEKHSLKHCSFDATKFTHELITKLCDLLKESRFTSLELNCASLSSAALSQIMDAIKQSSITSLRFNECEMKGEKITIICNLLESFNFEKLKLHSRYIKDEIIEQMLPSIRQSSITHINIVCAWTRMSNKLRCEIESIMQPRRQHQYMREWHTKSARQLIF